jgi:hypothetical protein
MCKKELEGKGSEQGGIKMSVMTKPVNVSLRVNEKKTKDFLSVTRDTNAMLKRFKFLKKMELRAGKTEKDPDVAFLSGKINDFEKEIEER